MPLTDLSLAECRDYRPELPVPDDFDAFWSSTLSEASADGGPVPKPVFTPVDTGLTQIRTYDVTLPGFAGRPVHGRLHLPAGAAEPLGCVAEYLKLHRDRTGTAFTTLSYFDAALLATRATAPALFSIAMMDEICPPSTCFTAYNNYAGPKDVRVYEFNGHEGGTAYQQREQLAWVRSLFAGPPSGRAGHS
ncbi:acetylxylan esterase [Streptomyces sp. NPDC053720]|uniref:acetylxylan esterase n=1 Tax=Streptomyces sp. NPDC053720 TaxID=3154855 RepID=UPI0034411941